MNFRFPMLLLVLLAGALLCAAARAQPAQPVETAAGQILIGGSGSSITALQLAGQAFKAAHPHASIVLLPGLGSNGGLNALRAGAIDLAVMGRPLKDAERHPDIVAAEYGRTPLVFATGLRTRPMALSLPGLVRIYSGETTAWPDGSPLRLVLRSQFSPETELLKGLSPAMAQAVQAARERPGMRVTYDDRLNADTLEKIPGTLGTVTLAQIIAEKRTLQALSIDGVAPSVAALMQGTYPYAKPLVLVSRAQATPLVQHFLAFLRSAPGRAILEANGHWVASHSKAGTP